MPEQLIYIVAALAIAGIILWAITQFPMDAVIVKLIRVVVIVVVAIYLIHILLGYAGGVSMAVPRR